MITASSRVTTSMAPAFCGGSSTATPPAASTERAYVACSRSAELFQAPNRACSR